MAKENLIVTDEDGTSRADKFLAIKFPEYSRAALAKLFLMNLIKINSEPIQPGHKLRPGTTIEYDLGPLQEKPDVIPLPIIFEDDNVIVVNKPAGIISHARGKFWQEASVASFIRDRVSGQTIEKRKKKEEKDILSTNCYSYVVGCDQEIRNKLEPICEELIQDGNVFKVIFNSKNQAKFIELIKEYLMPGFWNEVISVSEIRFIFKNESGEVEEYNCLDTNKSEIIGLCRKYAKKEFKSIETMLSDNVWYSQNGITEDFISSILYLHASERSGIVHRLDRATSGVMICAKNEATLSFLQKQFSDRKVEKTYVAVVKGKPKHDEAIIDAPIGRDLKTPQKFKVDVDGKVAQTSYKVIKQSDKYTTLELHPKTGRTHQLRVHLLYINLPIVGDSLYGDTPYSRLMLHARSLKITLPSGKTAFFEAPLPEEFDNIYTDL